MPQAHAFLEGFLSMVSQPDVQWIDALQYLNSEANGKIVFESPYYTEDNVSWKIWPTKGSCASYAWTKAAELIRAGIPADNIHFEFGKIQRDSRGLSQSHVIVKVEIDGKTYRLDNRDNRIYVGKNNRPPDMEPDYQFKDAYTRNYMFEVGLTPIQLRAYIINGINFKKSVVDPMPKPVMKTSTKYVQGAMSCSKQKIEMFLKHWCARYSRKVPRAK